MERRENRRGAKVGLDSSGERLTAPTRRTGSRLPYNVITTDLDQMILVLSSNSWACNACFELTEIVILHGSISGIVACCVVNQHCKYLRYYSPASIGPG